MIYYLPSQLSFKMNSPRVCLIARQKIVYVLNGLQESDNLQDTYFNLFYWNVSCKFDWISILSNNAFVTVIAVACVCIELQVC